MKCMWLFDQPRNEQIEILSDVEGLVVVGGYSGTAKESIKELESKFSDIRVKHLDYRLLTTN